MLFPRKHAAVNWIDGMKIARRHFLQTEDHFTDAIRDTASLFLHSYDFGLLPPFRGQRVSCDFEMTERVTRQVELRLRHCNAVTAGGMRIHIQPDAYEEQLVRTFSFAEEAPQEDGQVNYYSVVLSVNPYERVPAGTPDPEETPPRHPHVLNGIDLVVLPAEQVSAAEMSLNHLVIGQLVRKNGHISVNEQFIPPCTAIVSHPALIRYYEQFSSLLNDIQMSSFRIIEKVSSNERSTELAKNIKYLCEKMLDYIAQVFFSYRNMVHQQAPVVMVNVFSNLAHIFYTTLHYPGTRAKEEMLKYFYEWRDVTPGNFEDLLVKTIDIAYDHYHIQQSMQQVHDCMLVLSALWNKLSSLEFVGQRRENIVVAEQRAIEQTKTRNSWSLLD